MSRESAWFHMVPSNLFSTSEPRLTCRGTATLWKTRQEVGDVFLRQINFLRWCLLKLSWPKTLSKGVIVMSPLQAICLPKPSRVEMSDVFVRTWQAKPLVFCSEVGSWQCFFVSNSETPPLNPFRLCMSKGSFRPTVYTYMHTRTHVRTQ